MSGTKKGGGVGLTGRKEGGKVGKDLLKGEEREGKYSEPKK